MRALVIPREDSDPELLNDVLAPFCTVDLADSGEDAVSRFTDGFESGSPYGILFFLGIALPGMNGVQTALEIRNLEISRNKYPASTLCLISGCTISKETFAARFWHDINVFYINEPLNNADILTAIGYTAHVWGVSAFK